MRTTPRLALPEVIRRVARYPGIGLLPTTCTIRPVAVFDDFTRTDASPATHSESTADFLNRCADPWFAEVRELVESWFGHIPDDETRRDLAARLRSNDNRQFHAAFWELYLHESILRAGYDLVCHPELEGTSRRPDFLARSDQQLYVEARATFDSNDELAAERRRTRVYDALNRLDSPNFFLWVDVEGEGRSDLSTGRLRRGLEEWLRTLDPDDYNARLSEAGSILRIESFEWKDADWVLVFRPVPKSPEARGSTDLKPLGVFGPGGAYMLDDVTPLRNALSVKGTAYGSLPLPFVVAIRSTSTSRDEFDVLNALYGTLQVQLTSGPDGETASREIRAPDGYFHDATKWLHTNVSGVLLARNLSPWTVATDVPTLWLHPEPEKPLTPLPMWRVARAVDGRIEYQEPLIPPHELFGLPENWPPGEAFAGGT